MYLANDDILKYVDYYKQFSTDDLLIRLNRLYYCSVSTTNQDLLCRIIAVKRVILIRTGDIAVDDK